MPHTTHNDPPLLSRVPGKESGDIWELAGKWQDGSPMVAAHWDYHYTLDGKTYRLRIPHGFRADGASIPWWANGLVRLGGRVMPDEAWLPHDYFYDRQGNMGESLACLHDDAWITAPGVSRAHADKVFYKELKKHGLASYKPFLAYAGVRAAFWKNW